MNDYKSFYGWGTDGDGWFVKQYATSASAIRATSKGIEIMVSKTDAEGWIKLVWVPAYYDPDHSVQ